MNLSLKTLNYIRLFSTGLILIWLFLKSPFNPLYSESSTAQMNFVIMQFAYWTATAGFALWMLFFVNKSNFWKYSTFIFISVYGLYLTFYIFYGFDVTDTGFSLSKQWSMFHGMWKENFDAIAGTNLIGGLWLLIPGKPSLIWARVGFVILQVLIAFFSYKLLLLYFHKTRVFYVILPLTLFFAIWHFYFTVNYDNLPFIFFLTATYLFIQGLNRDNFQMKYFFISGFIIGISAFCKITYFAAIFFPLIIIFIKQKIENQINYQKIIRYYIFGLVVFLLFIIGFMYLTGGFYSYLTYFSDIITELISVKDTMQVNTSNHSFLGLYKKYKFDFFNILFDLIKYLFFILMIESFIVKSKNFKAIKYLLIIIGFYILVYLLIERNDVNQFTNSNPNYMISFFLAIYILWVAFTDNKVIKQYLTIVLACFGLFIFSFIGSDLRFRAAFHIGAGIPLFATALILIKECNFCILDLKFKPIFIFYLTLTIFTLNIFYKKDNLYREPQFKFISDSFETRSLAGIKSNPQRVDAVDSLLTYLNNISGISEKKIIFTHSNVLMYYLTGTNYSLRSPWDILNDYYTLKADLQSIGPDMFVVPEISHRVRTWPLNSEAYTDNVETVAQKYYEIYGQFIKENNYIEVYKNSFYTVYELKKDSLTGEKLE
ncbi:MAG TPA: hypothetical protein PLP37_07330 [Clostridiales bacterium]|nr:hypothetical protein [Clostridiales bacterium]